MSFPPQLCTGCGRTFGRDKLLFRRCVECRAAPRNAREPEGVSLPEPSHAKTGPRAPAEVNAGPRGEGASPPVIPGECDDATPAAGETAAPDTRPRSGPGAAIDPDTLRRMLAEGLNSAEMAERLGEGRTPSGVRQALRKMGVSMAAVREAGRRKTIERLRAMARDGHHAGEIAEVLGLSQAAVYTAAKRARVKIARPPKPAPPIPAVDAAGYDGPIHAAVIRSGFCRARGWVEPLNEAEARLAVAAAAGTDRWLKNPAAVARALGCVRPDPPTHPRNLRDDPKRGERPCPTS